MMPLKFRTLRSMGLLCLYLALNLLSQPALSQQDLLQKRISIDIKNLPVSKALITIGQQAGATISYGNSQLDENRKVTIAATNTTVADVIQQILGDELSDMMVAGDQIVIRTHEVSGTIHLTVTDMHGQPVPFAGVYLDNQQIAQTDEGGNYNLTKVRIGNHQIKVSSVGFQSQTKSLRMTRNGSLRVTIKLDEDSQSLQTVEVVGRKEKSYKNDASFIGSKIETKLKDLPQSVSYVTKELIADQGAMRVGDVLRNISGVSPFSTYDDINIRGFRIEGNKNTQLVNGMRSFTGYWKQPSINYLERVEVLKGPSSALFGNASPGGVINRVTKKPLDEARKSLQFSVGSFNAIRTLADFTGPIDKDKKLLYRLNLGYENAQSFRDLIFDKNLVIAPSFSFLPSAKTRLNFDMVYNSSQSRLDRAQAVFDNGDLYSTPVSRTMNTSNDFLNEQNYTVTASINHQILNNLSVNASFMKTGYQEDLNEHRSINTYAKDVNGAAINNQVFRHHWVRQSKRFMDNFTAFLNYHISTGNVAHKLVLGYDYALQVVPLGGSQMTATGYRNRENTGFFSDYDPKKKELYLLDPKTGNPVPNVPFYDLNNPAKSHEMQDISKYFYTSTTVEPAYYKLQSTYLQDQITVGRLQILAGLRYEVYRDVINYKKPNTETVTQQVILPRLGMVYTVNKNINVYGTYVQGYNPQTAAAIANPNAGGPFDPLESNMSEIGLKSSWLDGDLEFTSSLYQIKQKNTLYSASSTENPDLLEQIGRERAKGFEFDLQGKILPNWNLLLSYAYNDAQITESANTYDLNVQKPNAPKNSGNLWTRYSVAKGVLRGFAVGLGVSYADARNLRVRGNEKQSIPSYTLINAALYYNVGKAQLQFNLNNVVNKTYWVGGYDYVRLFPGAPRNSMVTLIYSL